jgi:hypothetical protein
LECLDYTILSWSFVDQMSICAFVAVIVLSVVGDADMLDNRIFSFIVSRSFTLLLEFPHTSLQLNLWVVEIGHAIGDSSDHLGLDDIHSRGGCNNHNMLGDHGKQMFLLFARG